MTQTQVSLRDPAIGGKPRTINAVRLFYPAAAVLMAIIAFIGFSRFYLDGQSYPGRDIPPPIKWLVIAHGSTMSLWMLLLVIQPMLVQSKKLRIHMLLGKVGAAFAVLIVVFGLMLAVRATAITPPDVSQWQPFTPKQFMAIPFLIVLVFAVFIALGVWYRRKPAIHRSMMILGTIAALSAAFARIDPLNALYLGTMWDRLFGPFFFTVVLGVILLAVRSSLARKLDRPFAIGLIGLALATMGIMQIAPTPAWESFASLFVA